MPFTVISIVSVVEATPPTVAVVVYFVNAEVAVGVPVITQVVVFKVKPEGSDGDTEQTVGVPPTLFGVFVETATLRP